MNCLFNGPVLAIMLCAPVVVLVFTGARRPLLLESSILAANKSLRIFNITKMAAKRSQRAMLNGQYRVFNLTLYKHNNSLLNQFDVVVCLDPSLSKCDGRARTQDLFLHRATRGI